MERLAGESKLDAKQRRNIQRKRKIPQEEGPKRVRLSDVALGLQTVLSEEDAVPKTPDMPGPASQIVHAMDLVAILLEEGAGEKLAALCDSRELAMETLREAAQDIDGMLGQIGDMTDEAMAVVQDAVRRVVALTAGWAERPLWDKIASNPMLRQMFDK